MRAVVLRDRELVVDELPEPEPRSGEVIVRTLACGICGSDLHARLHTDQLVEAAVESGMPALLDPGRDIVMGHEFAAEILDHGPDTMKMLKPGTRVVSMPLLFRDTGPEAVGFSNTVPGGYGERMVLSEMLLLEVPNGLSSEHAALTEPMAVGIHAVAMARMTEEDASLVIGCGPVGLAVIAALRLEDRRPIVASDFSPARRALAATMGADVVVDPREKSAVMAWAQAAGAKNPVLFECVGVPGLLHDLMKEAPRGARIVVAGVCMETDRIKPVIGINKELSLQFVLGYTPDEFARSLRALAEGEIPAEPMITGHVGLGGVAEAFETLANPEKHAKILVEPDGS